MQTPNVDRAPGLSVRLKLTLSYAGFLMLAGALLLAVVWVFLLRYVPDRVVLAYTVDTVWRNRSEFLVGREEVHAFLVRKWERELDYALRKELWAFAGDRIAVRFQYECHDASGQWWRSYGNELWEFTDQGLMRRREASINDLAIADSERRIHGPRPAEERGVPFPIR